MKAEIAMLAKRVHRLENDMVKVKQEQYQHECQLDALAIELHQFREEMHEFQDNVNDRFIKVDKRFDKMETRFDKMDDKLDLILNALAINA